MVKLVKVVEVVKKDEIPVVKVHILVVTDRIHAANWLQLDHFEYNHINIYKCNHRDGQACCKWVDNLLDTIGITQFDCIVLAPPHAVENTCKISWGTSIYGYIQYVYYVCTMYILSIYHSLHHIP